MYLTQGLQRALQQNPDVIATIYQGRQRTYQELGDRVARSAALLRSIGVQPGDRVGMLGLNSDWYFEFYLSVYWAGGVVNPANIRWSPLEIAYSLNDCDTRVLFVDDHFLSIIDQLREKTDCLKTLIYVGDGRAPAGMLDYEEALKSLSPVTDAMRGGEDLAGVFYTGGTTGWPKGVMLPHRSLYTNSICMIAEGAGGVGRVGLHAAPMFHMADYCLLNTLMQISGTNVIIPKFEVLDVMQAIERHRVEETILVPTMIQALVDHPDIGNYDLSSLANVLYAGSPISEGLLVRALQKLPNAGFTQLYGMTELSPVVTVLSRESHKESGRAQSKHRSAGRTMIGCEVKVVGLDDNELPRCSVGEVIARGPGTMLGYWNRPAETSAALRNGWMHTGDGGYMDEDGFVYIVDRIKDMIVTGGENVYSAEVETALSTHAAVASCAVIGIPSVKWGEIVQAFVIVKDEASATEADLIAHCKTRIAGYKCPKAVVFVDSMPLSGAGKILKTVLREPYWRGRERNVS